MWKIEFQVPAPRWKLPAKWAFFFSFSLFFPARMESRRILFSCRVECSPPPLTPSKKKKKKSRMKSIVHSIGNVCSRFFPSLEWFARGNIGALFRNPDGEKISANNASFSVVFLPKMTSSVRIRIFELFRNERVATWTRRKVNDLKARDTLPLSMAAEGISRN